MRRSARSLLGVIVLLGAVSLAGCGSESSTGEDGSAAESTSNASSSPSASEASSVPEGPACDAVWQDGATLPGRYRGCRQDDTYVKADKRYCEFGKPLITFEDHFYAVRAGRIHETASSLEGDRGYKSAMASCMA
jgi:hypothetical protein